MPVIKEARITLAHFIAYDWSGACPESLDVSWEFPSEGTQVYSTIHTHLHPEASCLIQFTSWHEFGWLRQTREPRGTPGTLMDHTQKLYTDKNQWHKLVPVFCGILANINSCCLVSVLVNKQKKRKKHTGCHVTIKQSKDFPMVENLLTVIEH